MKQKDYIQTELERQSPNEICIKLSLELVKVLFENNFYFYTVGITVEDGLAFTLPSPIGTFYVEIYNTGEIAYAHMERDSKEAAAYGMVENISGVIEMMNLYYQNEVKNIE